MKAYLFAWNPIKWKWDDLDDDIGKIAETGVLKENWSVASHKTIRPGDRAYIVRVGAEPKGIFASGYVTSEPYPAFRNGRTYYRVNLGLDVLLNPDKEPILTMDILKTGNLTAQNWTPQASGISIKLQLADELEGVWLDFLNNNNQVGMSSIKPIFRIFDYDKAVEFYVDWLGFTIDWIHEFEPDITPKYIQISLRDIVIHLSEHHGDASPGSHINIDDFTDLTAYNRELKNKKYKYGRPGLVVPPWNKKAVNMTVHDPFGNRITFGEELK